MREIISLETSDWDDLLAALTKAEDRWSDEKRYQLQQRTEEIERKIREQRHGRRTGQTGPLGGKQNG